MLALAVIGLCVAGVGLGSTRQKFASPTDVRITERGFVDVVWSQVIPIFNFPQENPVLSLGTNIVPLFPFAATNRAEPLWLVWSKNSEEQKWCRRTVIGCFTKLSIPSLISEMLSMS